jgi:hypothetical protein
MSRCQVLRFLHLGQTIVVPPPGDQRLWQALTEALGTISCRRFRVFGVEWHEGLSSERYPKNEDWSRAFVLDGLTTVSPMDKNDALCVQRRRLGRDADAGAILLREWLALNKFPTPLSTWVADSYEFENAGDPAALADAVQGLIALGARSGMCEPESEQVRLLRPGAALGWDYPSQEQGEVALAASVQRLFTDGKTSRLRHRFNLRELRPRAQPRELQLESPLMGISGPSEQTVLADARPEAGPLHMVAAVPRNSSAASSLLELQERADESASLSDRALGLISLRESATNAISLEPLGQFSRKRGRLSGPPNPSCRLWALGPWDLRNTLAVRRAEAWFETNEAQVRGTPEIVDGLDDWLLRAGHLFVSASGWSWSVASARALAAASWDRSPSSRLLLFWADLPANELRAKASAVGLPLLDLGAPTNSGKLECGGSTREVESLREELESTVPTLNAESAQWTHPELKSPSYGFEKVAIFPDQYLMRVLNYGQRGWVHRRLAWPRSMGAQFRGITMRNPGNFPLTWIRWSSLNGSLIEALGSFPGVASADPRAAGALAFEMAYRSLVAQGLMPGAATTGSAWFTAPRAELTGDEGTEAAGAYAMALDGLMAAASEAGVDLIDLQAGAGAPRNRKYMQEAVVLLRGRVDEEIQPVLPGFRMSGEVIYAVGPRPPFVDLGSRILNHVRLLSTHVTRLSWPLQSELYQFIHRCLKERLFTCVRPIGPGGIAESLAEMGLWSGIGVQLKPTVPTIEIFSGAPGRFLVGVLPQDAKRFEAMFKSEWITHVGATGGEKLFGLPLSRFSEEREEST